jgi:hypothetical protein
MRMFLVVLFRIYTEADILSNHHQVDEIKCGICIILVGHRTCYNMDEP